MAGRGSLYISGKIEEMEEKVREGEKRRP